MNQQIPSHSCINTLDYTAMSSNQNSSTANACHLWTIRLAQPLITPQCLPSGRLKAMNFICQYLKPSWLVNAILNCEYKKNVIHYFYLKTPLDHGKKILLPVPTLQANSKFFRPISFPTSCFFVGHCPKFNSSCINLSVTVLILWRNVTETKGPLFQNFKIF